MTLGRAPLAGVRVVEFGNLIAAPYCGMLLADLGADVTKVEPPKGDLARQIGPFQFGESVFFMAVNRGKRSLAADTKQAAVRRWVKKLCLEADVVVHNLRRGAMAGMGLGYDQIAASNQAVVYTEITAFGAEGPYADRVGIDLIFQGESGMMSITGEPGEPPHKTATTIGDFVAGTNAALAICAALVEREKSGRGMLIDVPLRDGLIAVQAGWNALYFSTKSQPELTGTASPITAPNQTFSTADGFLNVAIVSDQHFRKLCDVLGLGSLAGDSRFSTNDARVKHRRQLADRLQSILTTETTGKWMSRLQEAGLPAGRVLNLAEVFSDPQVLHNRMMVESRHPVAGPVITQGSPIRLDREPALAEVAAPGLGQHSRAVLEESGAGAEALEEAVAAGWVVT
jgi:crotonobetainyl-CoA:carnitine CoA-transferase CaiB-like acyl-CoA transferase